MKTSPTFVAKSNATPAMTYARTARYEIRLMPVPCPFCGRMMQASDTDAGCGFVRLLCRGCHQDVFTVGDVP